MKNVLRFCFVYFQQDPNQIYDFPKHIYPVKARVKVAAIMAYMIIYHFLSLATQVKIALENSLYNFLSQASQVIIALDNSLEAEFITRYMF